VPLHRHDCEELLIVHAGRGTYTVGDTTTEAGAGEVVVTPAGEPHRWVNHTDEPLVHTADFPTDRFALEEFPQD
jgi:quercetin dioxygenase-like cupin family protein